MYNRENNLLLTDICINKTHCNTRVKHVSNCASAFVIFFIKFCNSWFLWLRRCFFAMWTEKFDNWEPLLKTNKCIIIFSKRLISLPVFLTHCLLSLSIGPVLSSIDIAIYYHKLYKGHIIIIVIILLAIRKQIIQPVYYKLSLYSLLLIYTCSSNDKSDIFTDENYCSDHCEKKIDASPTDTIISTDIFADTLEGIWIKCQYNTFDKKKKN